MHHFEIPVELFDVLGRGGQHPGMLHYGSTRDINRSIHQKTAMSAFDAIYCLTRDMRGRDKKHVVLPMIRMCFHHRLVCWSLTSLCHSNGHIETMPAR